MTLIASELQPVSLFARRKLSAWSGCARHFLKLEDLANVFSSSIAATVGLSMVLTIEVELREYEVISSPCLTVAALAALLYRVASITKKPLRVQNSVMAFLPIIYSRR